MISLNETCQCAMDACDQIKDWAEEIKGLCPDGFGTAQGGTGSFEADKNKMHALLFCLQREVETLARIVWEGRPQ